LEVNRQRHDRRVKRELEIALPEKSCCRCGLLTIQSGIKKLRYATLMGIKKAKTKEVKTVSARELGVDLAGRPEWSASTCRCAQSRRRSCRETQSRWRINCREVEIRGAVL